jgi:hypothetical protein
MKSHGSGDKMARVGNGRERKTDRRSSSAQLVWAAGLLCLILGGCASIGSQLGGSKPAIGYSFAFDQKDHLDALLAAGKLDDAHKVYVENKNILNSDPKKYQDLLLRLANGLNENFRADLTAAVSFLDGMSIPLPPSEWPSARPRLKSATAVRDRYDGYELLRTSPYRLEIADALGNRLTQRNRELQEQAVDQLVRFDGLLEQNFFEFYPSDVSEKTVLAAALPALLTRLRSAGSAQKFLAFGRLYATGDRLSDDQINLIGNAYLAARMQEIAPGRERPSDVLQAYEDAKNASLKITRIDPALLSIAVVMRDGARRDFPVSVAPDVPISVIALSEVSARPAGKRSEGGTVVGLLTMRGVRDSTMEWFRRLT